MSKDSKGSETKKLNVHAKEFDVSSSPTLDPYNGPYGISTRPVNVPPAQQLSRTHVLDVKKTNNNNNTSNNTTNNNNNNNNNNSNNTNNNNKTTHSDQTNNIINDNNNINNSNNVYNNNKSQYSSKKLHLPPNNGMVHMNPNPHSNNPPPLPRAYPQQRAPPYPANPNVYNKQYRPHGYFIFNIILYYILYIYSIYICFIYIIC